MFHRFVNPTYYNPSGFDLLNVVSGGTGGGGSSFADGAKVGGPTAGTYLVAFGEDATSSNANRGLRALGQNTDVLDDLFHRDIAISVRTNDVTPITTVTSVTLPINTFLGVAGTPNTVAGYNMLFEVTDSNDREIIDASDVKCQVSSVTLGAGDLIGGGGANGSFSGHTVQINISPAIPVGATYHIYYGTRSNLATLPADGLTNIKIRGAQEIAAEIEATFQSLRGDGGSWNSPWPTTITDLISNGLQQRYMRSSFTSALLFDVPPAAESYWPAPTIDTAGSGGYILRRGPALTLYAHGAGAYVDPLNALLSLKFFDDTISASGGAVGLAVYGSRRSSTAWTGESDSHVPGTGAFAHLWPHYFATSLSTTAPKTRVVNGTSALFALVGAYNVDSGEAIVQLTSPNNFFRNGGVSAVNLGYDLLECTHPVGITTVTRTYVIVGHGSTATPTDATKIRVRNLDGTVPNFTAPVTGTVKWISTTMWVGDGASEYHTQAHFDVGQVKLGGLFYQTPQDLSTGADDDIFRQPPSFAARENISSRTALRWGGFNPADTSSTVEYTGFLGGDGSLIATKATVADAELTTGTFKFDTPTILDLFGHFRIRSGSTTNVIDNGAIVTNNGTVVSTNLFHATAGTVTFDPGVVFNDSSTASHFGVQNFFAASAFRADISFIAASIAHVTNLSAIELETGSNLNIRAGSGVLREAGAAAVIHGPTSYVGTAAYRETRHVLGTNANTTFVPSDQDAIHVPVISGGAKTYTLNPPANNAQVDISLFWYYAGDTPAGAKLGPTQAASSSNLHIVSSTGSVDIVLPVSPGAVNPSGFPGFYSLKFHFDGTNWKTMELQPP